jgi:N-hydroxyarylamine O-acetyltransferase
MDRAKYLQRIGVDHTSIRADVESLRLLQRQHLLNVPFENLDIHWKRPIILDTDKFFSKIVEDRRGGYCYELNGLFNQLLRGLGFRTHLVSGQVYGGENGYSPEFDHMGIVVMVGNEEYLADVGFGDFTFEPLKIDLYEEQTDREGTFIVRPTEHGALEIQKLTDGKWTPELLFNRTPRELNEFSERNEFQQHSPDSHFTRKKICSIVTEKGRKTLTADKFIVSNNAERVEAAVGSPERFDELLKQEFGIEY